MNVIDILDDQRFFGPLFRDKQSWRAWRVFLRALFGIPITDLSEKELFQRCTGLQEPKNSLSRDECGAIIRLIKSINKNLKPVYSEGVITVKSDSQKELNLISKSLNNGTFTFPFNVEIKQD